MLASLVQVSGCVSLGDLAWFCHLHNPRVLPRSLLGSMTREAYGPAPYSSLWCRGPRRKFRISEQTFPTPLCTVCKGLVGAVVSAS